jgi:hypothetical protein
MEQVMNVLFAHIPVQRTRGFVSEKSKIVYYLNNVNGCDSSWSPIVTQSASTTPRIEPAINFFVNVILICYKKLLYKIL